MRVLDRIRFNYDLSPDLKCLIVWKSLFLDSSLAERSSLRVIEKESVQDIVC